ncbi:hypothetical protein ACHOLT_13655 [Desulfitobacterium sp. Sab5]|uniref:hypothetical protein n=1 Tax=Desulfitobacterium nosdiversum TaxID=3375356 RepID=UPI003CF44040
MWSLLISVSTEVEADIIKGLLDQSQIQVQKKYPLGSLKDSYGIENGVELWVPSDVLDQARTLIDTLTKDSETINEDVDKDHNGRGEDGENEKEEQEAKPMYKTNSSINKRVLLAILLSLIIILYWLMRGSEMF